MTYEVQYGLLYTRIEQWHEDGRFCRVILVHRSEFRHWDA